MSNSSVNVSDRRFHSPSRLGFVLTLVGLFGMCLTSIPASGSQPSTFSGDVPRFEAPHLGILPPQNPASNEPPNPYYANGCSAHVAEDNSIACIADILASIDNARALEDVPPLSFDLNSFETMVPSEQLFVIANLERIDRGLQPFAYLTTQLDQVAQTGADDSTDPIAPGTLSGGATVSSWGGNWEAGSANALGADEMWMYDDGFGSSNEDCPTASAPGCWGHRDNILMPGASSGCYLAMGAASDAVTGGFDYTEVFVNACGVLPSDPTISWDTVESALQGDGQFQLSTQTLVVPSDYFANDSDWLEVENATTPCTWSISSGMLPPGFTLSSAGQLTGPNSEPATSFTFTVLADETGAPFLTASKVFSLGAGGSSGTSTTTTTIASPTTTTTNATTTTTLPAAIPSAPRIRATSPSNGDLLVVIIGSINSYGDAIRHYQTLINAGLWRNISQRVNGTFLIRNLKSGHLYLIRLRAVSEAGTGRASKAAVVRIK